MFKQKKYKYKLQFERRMLNAQVNTMMLNYYFLLVTSAFYINL